MSLSHQRRLLGVCLLYWRRETGMVMHCWRGGMQVMLGICLGILQRMRGLWLSLMKIGMRQVMAQRQEGLKRLCHCCWHLIQECGKLHTQLLHLMQQLLQQVLRRYLWPQTLKPRAQVK